MQNTTWTSEFWWLWLYLWFNYIGSWYKFIWRNHRLKSCIDPECSWPFLLVEREWSLLMSLPLPLDNWGQHYWPLHRRKLFRIFSVRQRASSSSCSQDNKELQNDIPERLERSSTESAITLHEIMWRKFGTAQGGSAATLVCPNSSYN